MCIIVGTGLDGVCSTNIFARGLPDGRQVLVYAMELMASEDQAMILPLPVPPGSSDGALRFINLESCVDFFHGLRGGFRSSEAAGDELSEFSELCLSEPLPVHKVGDFEASFVPSHRDWRRLDPRFRLAREVWDEMPLYADYGFAVFQLAIPPSAAADSYEFHPMAFEFPRRNPDELFFPTVHVHDGCYHATAAFDHSLYCQHPAPPAIDGEPWRESEAAVGSYLRDFQEMDVSVDLRLLEAEGVLDVGAPCHRQVLHGERANRDIVLS